MHKPRPEEEITSLHDLSAVDLIAGYKARQFSPSEVMEDVIAHVARWEPHIKALYAFDPDGARKAAKASTDRWNNNEPVGVLDGVPATIKDNIATKGQPMWNNIRARPQVLIVDGSGRTAKMADIYAITTTTSTTQPGQLLAPSGTWTAYGAATRSKPSSL